MVFCCIAIVAIAIVYFIGLWIRQLFLGRHRDLDYPQWPPPPRALAGNGAWPVYGHTRLFRRHVGDVALRFDAQWTEWGPFCSQRPLGDCFAIFIWGQWRIGIQGPARAQQFFQHQMLHEGWPWTPPVTLLGKSCLAFLQQEDPAQAVGLRGLLQTPLSAGAVVRFAPLLAQAAEQCLVAVEQGVFRKANKTPRKQPSSSKRDCASPLSSNDDWDEDLDEDSCCKLKWEALRSYSLDLFNGPLFQMNLWNDSKNDDDDDDKTASARTSSQEHTNGQEPGTSSVKFNKPKDKNEEPPSREVMLLWMERIKLGLDVIKLTFGPEWMYVWMFNEYGRAINARMYVEKLVGEHVERMVALVPQVTHERGHVYHEPTTQPFPLLTMHQNLMHSKEGIFGDFSVYPKAGKTSAVVAAKDEVTPRNRTRCNSMPSKYAAPVERSPSPVEDDENGMTSPYVKPFKMEQDLARPNYESSPIRRPVTVKRDGSLSENPLLKELSWKGLKEIHVQDSNQNVPISPLSEWGNSLSHKMTLPQNELPTNLATPFESADETKKAKRKRQRKSVDAVFNEIKANRDKQKHLTDENEVVYSFFNPARRKSSDGAEVSAPVIKAVKTMSETKLTESKQNHVARLVTQTSNITQEPLKEALSQPQRQATHVNKTLESPSLRPETSGTSGTTLLSSSKDSRNLDGRAPAPLKSFLTPQASFRQQRRLRSGSVKKRTVPDTSNANVSSLLEALLQQRGPEGKGISQTTLTELIINLWMMLEVGNAWTAMALNLLAWDDTALGVIQEELDVLEIEFGSKLFSPESLDRMKYLDALIYESIRLIPPFLGGLKSTTETVVLNDAGVQIPKGSHIFFCQPSTQEFDLFAAVGQRPECLGQKYPCVELFGFLPLQGLEVPLMVLQCKVFLIVTLRNYAPTVTKRNTFIRRVKSAVSFRKNQNAEGPETSMHSLVVQSDMGDAESGSNYSIGTSDLEDGIAGQCCQRMTPSEAMKRFTKIPFPEPKRVIQLKPRGL